VAGRVWRALYLNDNRVFYAKEETTSPDFTVDLMLDASASRGGSQKVIAAQAYVISESLRMCGIPSQIYSFCTLRGYTVLNIFKTYKENKRCANVFNYCATGWNRDGLAFRGARELMGEEGGSKKILIVLTDAQPNDDRSIVSESNPFIRHDYSEERAVADTAGEVASLRRENIRVIGLINDEIKGGMGDAKEIYGQDFIHVRDLEKMAESVGTLLARQIASL
jgi:nitric oxide reductase activation protein